MKIQFVGSKKTGQDRYRGSSSLSPNLVCILDQPQTCTLEVGIHLTDNEAFRLLTDHKDIFITHDTHLANLAAEEATAKKAAAAAKRKASAARKKSEAKAKPKPKPRKPRKAAGARPKPGNSKKTTTGWATKKPAAQPKSGDE
jgi:hypothetical protein